jgi:hypothetical protein
LWQPANPTRRARSRHQRPRLLAIFATQLSERTTGLGDAGGGRGTGIQHSLPRNAGDPTDYGRPPPRLARRRPRHGGQGEEESRKHASFHSVTSSLGLRDGRCETLRGDGLRKTPRARALPCCRSCAGHRSCNRRSILSPSPRTRAPDSADSPPPGARRC